MSDTITISAANARKAYEQADKTQKKTLAILLGDVVTKPRNIMDRVKSYEDACEVLGESTDLPIPCLPNHHLNAQHKVETIIRALNEGWEPDWKNSNEYKYFPWFRHGSAGFWFVSTICGNAISCVGSRLYYKSAELCKYGATQFIDLYNQFMTIK